MINGNGFFYAGIAITLLAYLIPRSMLMKWLILLPGVIAHELAHWIIGFLTFSRPSFPNLIPKRQGNEWILGTVYFVPGFFTAAFVALAPLYILPVIAIKFVLPYQQYSDLFVQLLAGYILSVVLIASLPSSADWKIAFSRPVSFVVFVVAATLIMDHFGMFQALQGFLENWTA